jgi:adenine-specific DNA-methyltransferase
MNLKQALLAVLEAEQLKELCAELELEADRRSPEDMAVALSGAKRAKPELLIAKLTVPQLRAALQLFEEPTDGRKEELVQRLLLVGGRTPPVSSSSTTTPPAATVRASGTADLAAEYRHSDQVVQRPEAGVQDQFQSKKPPRDYRYDSSIDPALSWDEQRERDLSEWLLGLIVRAAKEGEPAVFAEAQVWKGGGVRASSVSDTVQILQQISRPFLNWAGKAERHEIRVPAVPLFVHERHSTKAVLDGIRHRKARGQTLDLFGDAGMDIRENLEAYEHKGPWQNRMILGDSLAVMNSLLEFEGLGGHVQMIYVDPPYGVKFGSNFQPFVRKRDVKHGEDGALTREPEMVKAYRDTWELGLHSYLTYLRDRILVARDLLNSTGSLFVQISDENLHHVTELLDELFGSDNRVSVISFVKTSGLAVGDGLTTAVDYILWYAKDRASLKVRNLYVPRQLDVQSSTLYSWIELPGGSRRKLTAEEQRNESLIPEGAKRYRIRQLDQARPWFQVHI